MIFSKSAAEANILGSNSDYYLLLTAYCLLLTAYYLLLITYYLPIKGNVTGLLSPEDL